MRIARSANSISSDSLQNVDICISYFFEFLLFFYLVLYSASSRAWAYAHSPSPSFFFIYFFFLNRGVGEIFFFLFFSSLLQLYHHFLNSY